MSDAARELPEGVAPAGFGRGFEAAVSGQLLLLGPALVVQQVPKWLLPPGHAPDRPSVRPIAISDNAT